MEFEATKPSPTPTQDSQASLSEQLVGEGKPFKTIEDLAKGKFEADTFIEQLKAENAQMLAKLSEAEQEQMKGATVNQVLEAVRALSQSGSSQDPQPNPAGEEPSDGNQPGLTEEDIKELVSRTLKQTETVKKQESNYESVRKAFQKQYVDADKARLQYKAVADSLGLKEEQLDEFARMNPKLVLRAAGLEQVFKSTQTPPSYLGNEHNTEALGGDKGVDAAHDNSWWEEQRKSKGNAWYFQPRVQQAYWKDVKALGDSFLNKD